MLYKATPTELNREELERLRSIPEVIRHLTWDLQYQLNHRQTHKLKDEIVYKKTIDSAVIAGGFAAWVLGITDRYGDVDIFYNRPVSSSTHQQYKFRGDDLASVKRYPNSFHVIHITDPMAIDIIFTTKPKESQDELHQMTAQDYAIWLLHNFDVQACKAAIYRDINKGWCKVILSHPVNPLPNRMRHDKYYRTRNVKTKVPMLKHLCQQNIDAHREHTIRLINLYKASPIKTDYHTFKTTLDRYNALTYQNEPPTYLKRLQTVMAKKHTFHKMFPDSTMVSHFREWIMNVSLDEIHKDHVSESDSDND